MVSIDLTAEIRYTHSLEFAVTKVIGFVINQPHTAVKL